MRISRVKFHYGANRAQVAELWRLQGVTEPLPVVVLIHGGFWRGIYSKRIMHRLAADVARRGWVAWNVEYRRVGRLGGGGGWPETFLDVAAAVDHLRVVEGVDLARVAVCGHSAGGHLALWSAGRNRLPPGAPGAASVPAAEGPLVVRIAISLAGVADLVVAHTGPGAPAIEALVGGSPEDVPDRYALTSPASLVPLGVEQVLIHGLDDSTVPALMSEQYALRAAASGDLVEYKGLLGVGHREMIDPNGDAWQHAVACLERSFG